MANIAETVKKQTDRILRQRSLNQTEGVVVSGVSTGAGAPAPVVNNPPADLTTHKSSADHDGRYYTEGEIDGKLNFLTMTDTPAAYTGEGGKIVAVKADVSGLEFVAAPAAANGIPTGGTNNQLLAKDGTTTYAVKWVDAPEAANGLPSGGVAGQVLAKIDDANYNAQWVGTGGVLGAHIYLSTQTLDSASGSRTVTMDSQLIDDANMVDLLNNAIVAPANGWYFISGHVRVSTAVSGYHVLSVLINGNAGIIRGHQISASTLEVLCAGAAFLNAEDVITLSYYSGSSTQIIGENDARYTYLTVLKL